MKCDGGDVKDDDHHVCDHYQRGRREGGGRGVEDGLVGRLECGLEGGNRVS